MKEKFSYYFNAAGKLKEMTHFEVLRLAPSYFQSPEFDDNDFYCHSLNLLLQYHQTENPDDLAQATLVYARILRSIQDLSDKATRESYLRDPKATGKVPINLFHEYHDCMALKSDLIAYRITVLDVHLNSAFSHPEVNQKSRPEDTIEKLNLDFHAYFSKDFIENDPRGRVLNQLLDNLNIKYRGFLDFTVGQVSVLIQENIALKNIEDPPKLQKFTGDEESAKTNIPETNVVSEHNDNIEVSISQVNSLFTLAVKNPAWSAALGGLCIGLVLVLSVLAISAITAGSATVMFAGLGATLGMSGAKSVLTGSAISFFSGAVLGGGLGLVPKLYDASASTPTVPSL